MPRQSLGFEFRPFCRPFLNRRWIRKICEMLLPSGWAVRQIRTNEFHRSHGSIPGEDRRVGGDQERASLVGRRKSSQLKLDAARAEGSRVGGLNVVSSRPRHQGRRQY